MSFPTINFAPPTPFSTPSRPLTWLITGCSSGLGLALARHAQANGQRVIATSRNPSATPDLVREITTHPTAPPGRWLALDVTDPEAMDRVIAEVESASPVGEDGAGTGIDVLVNNAGRSIHQSAEQFTDEEVREQFETVFFGPYRLLRAVVPGMRKRRFGVVVNMSSGAALEGRVTMGIYAAAKAAMDGLIKVFAQEVAPFNIRTHTIHLGGFRTNMPQNIQAGKTPLAEDYKGTTVDQIMSTLGVGKYVGDGDPLKAVQVIYEMVMAQGEVGAGREAELLVPLGRDMESRVRLVRDRLDHCWEVFGDVAMNVYAEP